MVVAPPPAPALAKPQPRLTNAPVPPAAAAQPGAPGLDIFATLPEAAPPPEVVSVLQNIDWSVLSTPARALTPRPPAAKAAHPAPIAVPAPTLEQPPAPVPSWAAILSAHAHAPSASPLVARPPIAPDTGCDVPELALFAQAAAPAPEAIPAPRPLSPAPAENPHMHFAIFDSLLGPPRDEAPSTAPSPAGSTLSRLKHVVTSPSPSSLPDPVPGRVMREALPRLGGKAMPAAAVAVPLGEVMRLVALGGLPAASPFDTHRAALRAPSTC